MTFLKKVGCAAAIALAAGAAQAEAIMNNWTFNPAGTGQAAGQEINEYLDVNGNAFIELKASGASFSFTEHGVFNLVQADGNGMLFPATYPGSFISATLEASGTGSFNGAFSFSSGTIKMYQIPAGVYGSTAGVYGANAGKLIGEFTVLAGGGGMVDASGSPVSNGQVSILAKAGVGKLAAGYFFADNGVDMSTIESSAFAFTNVNAIAKPDAKVVSEVACEFAGYKGPGCSGRSVYQNVAGKHVFIGGNGQFKFADVPEPGSVALFGIALFGIGALRRRVK